MLLLRGARVQVRAGGGGVLFVTAVPAFYGLRFVSSQRCGELSPLFAEWRVRACSEAPCTTHVRGHLRFADGTPAAAVRYEREWPPECLSRVGANP